MTAADRPSVPQVGDTLTTAEQLDALPIGSVVRDHMGETHASYLSVSRSARFWQEVGVGDERSSYSMAREIGGTFTVLYVPGEQPGPSVTDNARAEGGRVSQIDCLDCGAMAVTVHHFDQCPAVWGAAGRAETPVIHLSNPDDGASFCDQPATIITEAGDTRPVCQTCHRRAMKHVRSGWCPCVSGRPQDCSPEKWPLSIRHGQGRAETTTATDDAVARVIWYAPTVDPGGVTVRDSETIAQALTERFHITERQQ